MMKPTIAIFVVLLNLALAACSNGFTASSSLLDVSKDSYIGGSGTVNLSWSANRETEVNKAGGGYRVYYAQSSSVTASTPYVDVPFVSGSQAPTNLRLTGLVSGTYYVHVKAYSAVNPGGSGYSSTTQFTVR